MAGHAPTHTGPPTPEPSPPAHCPTSGKGIVTHAWITGWCLNGQNDPSKLKNAYLIILHVIILHKCFNTPANVVFYSKVQRLTRE